VIAFQQLQQTGMLLTQIEHAQPACIMAAIQSQLA
jgi:hypothetical protein